MWMEDYFDDDSVRKSCLCTIHTTNMLKKYYPFPFKCFYLPVHMSEA